jgi:FlaA1/EpsC-like NDP-sugar epimerase
MNNSIFDNSRILITGGTGSWGQTLTRMLLERFNPKEIVIFSRGELQQVLMQRKFQNAKIKYIIGDVRDYEAVNFATKHVDYVFHMAALKHVPICEDQPQEAIKTNIIGTNNIVNACILNGVKKVIDVSTDKAVEPINLYGMTKSVGEKVIIQANQLSTKTRFVCVRGGNVMGSNGSVIPYFIEQIQSGGPVTITDREMTRFFLTLEEAIGLLFKAAEHSIGGETFVMNMPACRILDVATVLMDHYGQVDIIEMGAKPGEKLDEMLISQHEALQSYCYDENYYVILPTNSSFELLDNYNLLKKFEYAEFSSRTQLMDLDQIKEMLKKGGFL